jgi:hypothetical protein
LAFTFKKRLSQGKLGTIVIVAFEVKIGNHVAVIFVEFLFFGLACEAEALTRCVSNNIK